MEAIVIAAVVLVLVWLLSRSSGKGTCRECGEAVSLKAKVCPHCGNRFDQAPAA
jgi:predicted amidophosphoribosyltransferase